MLCRNSGTSPITNISFFFSNIHQIAPPGSQVLLFTRSSIMRLVVVD